jgi:predicted DCC family thiol-disulfide oxidoreductase YuxK
MNPTEHPIILFDGVCNLCNSWVDFVIKRDKAHIHHFASLQGETAAKLVPDFAGEQNLSTIVLVDAEGTHLRSTAVLRVFRRLGGFLGTFAKVAMIFPAGLRDGIYRIIAKNRYRMFGKRDSCRLQTKEERALFLD